MRALIEAKADQTARQESQGGTATAIELLLLHAAAIKHSNVAHVLSMSGADVNVRNTVRWWKDGGGLVGLVSFKGLVGTAATDLQKSGGLASRELVDQ